MAKKDEVEKRINTKKRKEIVRVVVGLLAFGLFISTVGFAFEPIVSSKPVEKDCIWIKPRSDTSSWILELVTLESTDLLVKFGGKNFFRVVATEDSLDPNMLLLAIPEKAPLGVGIREIYSQEIQINQQKDDITRFVFEKSFPETEVCSDKQVDVNLYRTSSGKAYQVFALLGVSIILYWILSYMIIFFFVE